MQEENNGNFNITPEMLNNLVSRLKNNSNINDSETNSTSKSNSSFIFENDQSKKSTSQEGFTNNLDFETILKMKNIIESLNKKDDPRFNLLYSLKPYLRESKRKKLDQYVNLLKLTDISEIFKITKGDSNK